MEANETYKILRFTFNRPTRTIKRGLTLAEAQAHCQDPETSSRTCTLARNKRRPGPWFEGYTKEG